MLFPGESSLVWCMRSDHHSVQFLWMMWLSQQPSIGVSDVAVCVEPVPQEQLFNSASPSLCCPRCLCWSIAKGSRAAAATLSRRAAAPLWAEPPPGPAPTTARTLITPIPISRCSRRPPRTAPSPPHHTTPTLSRRSRTSVLQTNRACPRSPDTKTTTSGERCFSTCYIILMFSGFKEELCFFQS